STASRPPPHGLREAASDLLGEPPAARRQGAVAARPPHGSPDDPLSGEGHRALPDRGRDRAAVHRREHGRRDRRASRGELRHRRSRDDRARGPRPAQCSRRALPDGGALVLDEPRPYTLIAELTYRCPLRCVYCSNPLELDRHRRELDAETWLRVFAEAEELGVVQVSLTGGEPCVRGDLEEIVVAARRLDLYTNLATSGVPLPRERLQRLRSAGLDNVQISIQDVAAPASDEIAGLTSFDRKLEVARWVK